MTSPMQLWKPAEVVQVPTSKHTPEDLVAYAKQLSPRESRQIIQAFAGGSYEMVSTFVWQKTMASLKRKLGDLGMDFIGEMLDRQDIAAGSNPSQTLTDFDALRLADELGFFPGTHSLRLRHSMEIVAHFADRPVEDSLRGVAAADDDDGMTPEEATQTLRVCIQTVLGHPETTSAVEFAKFRKELEQRSFKADDEEVAALAASPYFFRKTALRVLLALIKTAGGAQLQHALANLNAILPEVWPDLLKSDHHLVGWCYAELHAEGKQTAAQGVQRALLKVKGFDYVPESLRSRSYIEAARRVLEAHFGWNNFHNETAPMEVLKSMGTSIPMPAFPQCMTAVLCVKIGNSYGVAWAAARRADEMIDSLTPDQWVYYFDECFPSDDEILKKLSRNDPAKRFMEVVKMHSLEELPVTRKGVSKLLSHAGKSELAHLVAEAKTLHAALRTGRVK